MSIEYTLDIQLTEMGFPHLVPPHEASVAEIPRNSSASSNNASQKSLPDQHIQPLESNQTVEEIKVQGSVTEVTRSTLDLPENTGTGAKNGPAAQSKAINKTGLTSEDSSDDSDVSYIEDDIDDDDDVCEEEEDEEEEGSFPCTVCNLQCSSRFKLQDHMNLHTGARPYYCSECGKRFSQIHNYRIHLRSHSRAKTKQHRCRICLRRFVKESDLKYHLTMNHFEEKFYECDRCKLVFTCLKECQHHVEFSCTRKVMCENCGRYFPKEKLLKRHLESKRCYSSLKCTECSQVFARKNALLKHSFSHLGLLPYTCVSCRRHFRLARLYLRHKCKPQSIHCVACLREFLNDHDFQQHKKETGCWGNREAKGDQIRCLECGQRFDTKEDLKKHAGAHQRVLKCAECGKGFRSALLLMSHMGGHAGKSPCLCQSCGLGFPHQQSYDSHMKTCGQTSQPTKPSKKRKSTKRSEQKTTSSKPSPPDCSVSSAVFGTTASESTASSAVSEFKTVAAEHTVPDNSRSDQCQTNSRPSSSSASPSLETVAQDNSLTKLRQHSSPTKPTQQAQDDSSNPTKGCWKLSLDKPPPAGVNLLLFLPVSQNESSNLILPCAVPQVLSAQEIQLQASPVSNNGLGELRVSAVSGATCKQEMDPLPLDLSKKSSVNGFSNSAPILNIKCEPKEVEVSAPMKSSELTVQACDENNSAFGENKRPVDAGLQSSPSSLLRDNKAPKKIKMEPE